MKIDRELKRYIEESAEYLVSQYQRSFDKNGRPLTNLWLDSYNALDIEVVLDHIEDMKKNLDRAEKESNALLRMESNSRIPIAPETPLRPLLHAARKGIIDARIACLTAIESTNACRREARNKIKLRTRQESAARLAVGYFLNPEDRRCREVARKIMQRADIPEPGRSTFDNILKRIRAK